MDEYNEIGARLRELREVSDYSIEQLASELGIAPDVYASYEENGKDVPSASSIRSRTSSKWILQRL